MRRFSAGVLMLGLVLAGRAGAQLPYDRTSFLHGFNDGPARWTTPGAPQIIGSSVDLGLGAFTPRTHGDQAIDYQKGVLRGFLNQNGGQHVLVALSAGSLVARSTYIESGTNIAGIVAVAAPHQGTLLANNATRVTPYFVSVARTVLAPAKHLSFVAGRRAQDWVDLIFSPRVVGYVESQYGINSAAIGDLKTTSAKVAELNAAPVDAVPHANVYGVVSPHNAVFRLALSAAYQDYRYDEVIYTKNLIKSTYKACKHFGYFVVVGLFVESPCEKADNAIGNIDWTWAGFVNGGQNVRMLGFNFFVPYQYPFDGVVPNNRSRYPGLANGPLNRPAIGVNHMNIHYDRRGTDQVVGAMLAIGMQPRY